MLSVYIIIMTFLPPEEVEVSFRDRSLKLIADGFHLLSFLT